MRLGQRIGTVNRYRSTIPTIDENPRDEILVRTIGHQNQREYSPSWEFSGLVVQVAADFCHSREQNPYSRCERKRRPTGELRAIDQIGGGSGKSALRRSSIQMHRRIVVGRSKDGRPILPDLPRNAALCGPRRIQGDRGRPKPLDMPTASVNRDCRLNDHDL